MARRLSFHQIVLGTALACSSADLSPVCAQVPPANHLGKPRKKTSHPRLAMTNLRRKTTNAMITKREGDRRDGETPRWWSTWLRSRMILRMLKSPSFMLEVAKRDGGPLEFLAPLMKPEVRQELD